MSLAETPAAAERRPYRVLVWSCLVVCVIRLWWAARSHVWTGADSFYYTNLADSLAAGRGFVVDYVRFFFFPYETVANRPEDWVSPLYSLSMVPFIWLLGPTFLAYTATAILAGAIGFPLVTHAIARRLGARPLVACLSGFTALLHPGPFLGSQHPMTDVPFAVLIGLALYWYLRLEEGLKPATIAGLFLGLACLTRPVGLWLFPVLPLAHALRQRDARALFARDVILLLAVTVAVMSPWLIRNLLVFGSPFYSVYGYQGPMAGRQDMGIHRAYEFWWGRQPPTMLDRYRSGAAGRPFWMLAQHLVWALDMSFLGSIHHATMRATVMLSPWNYHFYQGLIGIPALVAIWRRRRHWEVWFVALVIGTLIVAVSVLNVPGIPRYFYVIFPLVFAFGWMGYDDLAGWLAKRRWTATGWLVTIAVLLALPAVAIDVYRGPTKQLPVAPEGRARKLAAREAALEVGQQMPVDAVLLVEPSVGMMQHYSRRPCVAVPSEATADDLDRVIQHYGIRDALLWSNKDPARYLRDRGWQTVFEHRRLVYLRWDGK